MAGKQYKVPLNGHPVDLADGRVIAPGERVTLSDQEALDPHNADLLAGELLFPVSEKGEEVQEKAEKRVAAKDKEVTG